MAKVVKQSNSLAAWMVERAFGFPIVEPFVGLVIHDDDPGRRVIGSVIFNNYIPGRNVEITAVGGGRAFGVREVREIARYAFTVLKTPRMTAVTSERNGRAIRGLKALGFKYEGRMRKRFDPDDGLVFGLLRDEQKLVRIKK